MVLAFMPEASAWLSARLPKPVGAILQGHTGLQPIVLGLSASLTVALVWNGFFSGPLKTWRSLYPLDIEIAEECPRPEDLGNGKQRHTACLVIKNRSPLKSIQCHVFVLDIRKVELAKLPWSVWRSMVGQGDQCRIDAARWFTGPGLPSECFRIPAEQSGGYAEATLLQIPIAGADFCFVLQGQGFGQSCLWCRIEVKNGHLVISRSPDQAKV